MKPIDDSADHGAAAELAGPAGAQHDEQEPGAEKKERYQVSIDGAIYDLQTPEPAGAEIMALAGKKPCAFSLAKVIAPDERVHISKKDVAQFMTTAKDMVTIFIDGKPFEIRPGMTPVSEIKRLGGVRDGYELDQEVDGALMPLPADGEVEIHGCEIFYSQTPAGGSS